MQQVGTMFGVKVYVSEEIKEGNFMLLMKKPLCTEICADPDLICVEDSHGAQLIRETEVEKARGWERIRNCNLQERYTCQFEGGTRKK